MLQIGDLLFIIKECNKQEKRIRLNVLKLVEGSYSEDTEYIEKVLDTQRSSRSKAEAKEATDD